PDDAGRVRRTGRADRAGIGRQGRRRGGGPVRDRDAGVLRRAVAAVPGVAGPAAVDAVERIAVRDVLLRAPPPARVAGRRRRGRRPWLLTALILAAMAVAAAGLAATFVMPTGRRAFQAGPLSDPHAFLADNCAACHTESFATARRFLPSNHDVRSASDEACLK